MESSGGELKIRFFEALPASRVEPQGRTLTPMEATQVRLSWRVARQRFGLPDVALEDSHPPTLSTSTTARVEEAMRIGGQLSEELGEDVPHGEGDGHGDGIRRMRVEEKSDDGLSTVTATMNKIDDDRLSQMLRKVKESKVVRKVKFASVIDQCDDGEVPGLGQAQIDEHFERIRMLKGSFPLVDSEPTNDQISAMRSRVVNQGLAPYADFAVFVPFGLRLAKLFRYQSHILQSDGTLLTVESPGPANWDIWYASWKVYTNALLGLVHTAPGGAEVPVMDCACLEEYVENFRKLVRDFPEAWHLNVQAEDRCRGEHFNRIRRRRAIDRLEGRAPGFLPHAPWADVFREAARDKQFWDEHVRDPALRYVARGGVDRPKPTGYLENVVQKMPGRPGSGKRALKRQRQMEASRGASATRRGEGDERAVCNELSEEFDSLNDIAWPQEW